jgi:hypothetical protein
MIPLTANNSPGLDVKVLTVNRDCIEFRSTTFMMGVIVLVEDSGTPAADYRY